MRKREPEIKTMKASEAWQQFSQILNQVFRHETRVIVEKSGIPVVGIISADDLERFSLWEKQRAEQFKTLEENWKAFEGVSDEEIEREVAKAVADVRKKYRASIE